ncbi:MAG: HAD-IC family P-type ATPase, partial [Bdellovibrionota bacterium]
MNRPISPWSLSHEELLAALNSNAVTGLTKDEAANRLKEFGHNVLKVEKKVSALRKFAGQFRNPGVLILIAAAIVAGLLGEITDSLAIIVIVFLNAVIGHIQEAKAEEAIEALKDLSAPQAKVLRDGEVIKIMASDVCMGDILVLEAGDYVPADARIIQASQLSTNEAVLTGESLPISKNISALSQSTTLAERENMLFASTAIATGSTKAIVTAIGMESEIGKIARLLDVAEIPKTALQVRLEQVSNRLLFFCAAVVIVVAILGIIQGEKWLDVLMTAIGLSVAAIPEGLPAVVTIALALAIKRMSKRNAIIRHLPAVETLGSTSVICTDKTGTLTTGKMRVRDIFPTGGDAQKLIESCVLCSNASLGENGSSIGDPTEVALLYLAQEHQVDIRKLTDRYPRIYEWSFDSNRKRMSVAVKNNNGDVIIHCKGAPESILELCTLEEKFRQETLAHIQLLSSQGKRLLAIASRNIIAFDSDHYRDFKSVERDLTFLGLVAMADPPREETIPAIKACQ